jgi:hypothetical protein
MSPEFIRHGLCTPTHPRRRMAAPKLEPSCLLTRPAPTYYPDAGASGIVTVPSPPRVPEDTMPEGQLSLSVTALDGLGELHLALSARVLQLEIQASTLVYDVRAALVREYIETARALRSLLLRVSIGSRVAEGLALVGFEVALGESFRWAYLWAIEEVESLACSFGDAPRSETRGLALQDHPFMLSPAAVAELEAAGDSADRVISALGAIDEAIGELVRRRRRIDWAWPGR